jgi:hypothetical protein
LYSVASKGKANPAELRGSAESPSSKFEENDKASRDDFSGFWKKIE